MFFFTLPLIFSHTDLVQPLELVLMVSAIFAVLYISTPVAVKNCSGMKSIGQHSLYQYLYQGWQGNISMWQVFWPFFVILNCSLLTADILAKTASFTVSSWDDVHLMLLIPMLWWSVAIWRSSAKVGRRVWSASARLLTLALIFELSLRLYIRMEYPRVFFNCQELLLDLDYVSCF